MKPTDFLNENEFHKRFDLLETSSVIIYVYSSVKEKETLSQDITFGQNVLHDQYNIVHYIERFKSKCIDIIFTKREFDHNLEDHNLEGGYGNEHDRISTFRLPHENSKFIRNLIKLLYMEKNMKELNRLKRVLRFLKQKFLNIFAFFVHIKFNDIQIDNAVLESLSNLETEVVNFECYNEPIFFNVFV